MFLNEKMRQLFSLLFIGLVFTACCASKKSGVSSSTKESTNHIGVTLGQVSHKFRDTGCSTVVIVNWQKPDEQIVLIPLDTLSSAFDVDGLEIYFNYQPLKRMNPPGCTVGFPAKLSDISKK